MVKDTPLCIFGKRGQDIKITVRPEIGAQGRAEQGKFFNLPLTAERSDNFIRNLKRRFINHENLRMDAVTNFDYILSFRGISKFAIRPSLIAAQSADQSLARTSSDRHLVDERT